MPKNEDGEFELILGNKQLLGVFFIVVVLLGVFFTMGYIVGRNSTPLATAENTPERKESKPLVVDSPARDAPVAPPQSDSAPARKPAPVQTAVQQADQPPAREQAKPAKLDTPKPKPAAAERPAPSPSGGTYLQLAATTQREADIEVEILRKKGFKAISAEIPEKRGMFRVLVGPLAESDLGKTKVDLQNAGFPGDKAIRRTL